MRLLLLLCCCCWTVLSSAQSTRLTPIINGSFDAPPMEDRQIYGWLGCYGTHGAPAEQLHRETTWQGTEARPAGGDGMMGLGLYDKGQRSFVVQLLPRPLEPGATYRITLQSRVPKQWPKSFRMNTDAASFLHWPHVGIYLGSEFCEALERVAVTDPVISYDWRTYDIVFTVPPGRARNFLAIGPEYDPNAPDYYNAYLLIDEVSNLEQLATDESVVQQEAEPELVAAVELGRELQLKPGNLLLEFGTYIGYKVGSDEISSKGLNVLRNVISQTLYRQGRIELVLKEQPGIRLNRRRKLLKAWVDEEFPKVGGIIVTMQEGKVDPALFQYENPDFFFKLTFVEQ